MDPAAAAPAQAAPTAGAAEAAEPAEAAEADGTLGYEQARDELGEVVRRLESGGVGLEESLRLWERGEHLVAVCERWLAGARTRLERAAGADRSGPGT